jgi:hypothetical protein
MHELKGEGREGSWVCNLAVTMGHASEHKQRDEGKNYVSQSSFLLHSCIAFFGEHMFCCIVLEVHTNHVLI